LILTSTRLSSKIDCFACESMSQANTATVTPILALVQHLIGRVASYVLICAIASLLLWRLWTFAILPVLRPNEPKRLPYWIRCKPISSSKKICILTSAIDIGNSLSALDPRLKHCRRTDLRAIGHAISFFRDADAVLSHGR